MQRRDVFGLAAGLVVGPLGAQGLSSPMPGVQPTQFPWRSEPADVVIVDQAEIDAELT